jgi:hypothetical protein
VTEPLFITPVVRCHIVPHVHTQGSSPLRRGGWRSTRYGEWVLVVDTETTTDFKQRLLVGGYLLARWDDEYGRYVVEQRGLFLPDDASQEYRTLVSDYAQENGLEVLPRKTFARLLLDVGYETGGLVVGFNLPFDLSRVAVDWGPGRKRFRKGFRLELFRSYSAPRIRVRTLTRPQAFIEWGEYRTARTRERGRRVFKGRFLDLQRLAYALGTERTPSLEGACAHFGVPYVKRTVTYGRATPELLRYLTEDVAATWKLFLAMREVWNRLPFVPIPSPAPTLRPNMLPEEACVDLDPEAVLPHRLQSPAGIAKALLRALGVRPFLDTQPDCPPELLGIFMSTLYGGHGECRIPGRRVPIRYLDISSTYTNMARLLGLWPVIAAERVEVADATEEVRAFIERITLEDLYDPNAWQQLVCVCLVEPEGDILPVVADWGTGILLALNPTWSDGYPMWWTLPDVVASKIRTGKAPKILKALRVVPGPRHPALRSIKLWGLPVSADDPFRSLLNIRRLIRLCTTHPKTRMNAHHHQHDKLIKPVLECFAYGIYAEMDESGTPGERVTVYAGGEGYEARSIRGERPGRFYHPLVAPFPPAACRLAVAMMEVEVHRAGGTIQRFATDAVCIVSTEQGGEVKVGEHILRALSWTEVDRIASTFGRLAPPGSRRFWKPEVENRPPQGCARDRNLYSIALSTHRFAMGHHLDDGSWRLDKYSRHGTGHLVLPEGFLEDMWKEVLAEDGHVDTSRWKDIPMLYEVRITRPESVSKRTAGRIGLKPYTFTCTLPVCDSIGMPVYRTGVCTRDGVTSTGCPDPQGPCPHRETCPLARPLQGILPHVRDPRDATTHPVFDRMTGETLQVVWPHEEVHPERTWYRRNTGHAHAYSLSRFVFDYLSSDERRYTLDRCTLHRRPVLLLPDPRTSGPRATGPRNILFQLYQDQEITPEEVLRVYEPTEDETLKALVRDVGIRRVARYAQLDKRELVRWLMGRKTLGPRRRARVLHVLQAMIHAHALLRSHPNRTQLAKQLGISPRTLRRYTHGHRPIPPDLLPRILNPGTQEPGRPHTRARPPGRR